MASRTLLFLGGLAIAASVLSPGVAAAQSLPGGGSSGGAGSRSGSDDGARQPRARSSVTPYIEVLQIVDAELSPGDDVLTYTGLAAGLDGTIVGNRSAVSASVRYEHRFGWGKAEDHDLVSGIARGYMTVTPGLTLEAGGAAFQSSIDGSGSGRPAGYSDDSSRNIYSVYGGPKLATQVGDVNVDGSYRIGYTRVETDNNVVTGQGAAPTNYFDDSVSQNATIHAGVRPYEVLPVGVGVGGSWYREDMSNLDQRVEDLNGRVDITVPVATDVALVGGVGYESVKITSRDALRDADGNPVVDRHGHYVTDKSEPREVAYDVDGLIWDAGVIWRPSRRTALEAHVGRRYGSTSVYGSFGYAPGHHTINLAVYDNVAGFGGQVSRALADMPTDFTAVRNPISGNFSGCVNSLESGSCLNNTLGSLRSAAFRARGVMGTYSYNFGRVVAGFGMGYDRRKFIAGKNTVLASANGVVDENYWMNAYFSGKLGERSQFMTSAYANLSDPGGSPVGDTTALGAAAQYSRLLASRFSATAGLAVDGVLWDQPYVDQWNASAMLGVRYSF